MLKTFFSSTIHHKRVTTSQLGSGEKTYKMGQNGFYSIVSSYTLRSNSPYKVAVSVHKNEDPCEIKITIKGPNYENIKTIEVQPMTTEFVEFDIQTLYEGSYELIAEGIKGIIFQKSIQLNFEENKPLIFIQTDKAVYKPGDLVKFRAIFLDEYTRPKYFAEPVNIHLSDGERNRLKQWPNIQLTKGVFQADYQLSEQPVLGNWEINIVSEGQTLESKFFEVEKYVLPKFSVSVEAPKDIAAFNGVINATIRAQYTYGKGVKGRATVSVRERSYHGTEEALVERTIQVDGQAQVQFKVGEDFSVKTDYITTMEIFVVMEEDLTGSKMEAKTTVDLHEHRFIFDGVDMPYDFHPGVPMLLKVSVKHLDYTPVLNSKNSLKLIIEKQRRYFLGSESEDEHVTIEKNNVLSELIANLDENGIATFEYCFPKDTQRFYYLKCEYLECQRHLTTLSKYDKPEIIEEEAEPLSVSVLTKEPKLGEDFEFEVTSSESVPYFVYTVHARGKHLKTEMVILSEESKGHVVKITPTFDMVPCATIFVHYVIDKDLRYENTTVTIDEELPNIIELTAPPETKPGEDIELGVKTEPGSFVGLLGVDQSVLLLKDGNDFDRDEVFSALNRLDNSTAWRTKEGRCPGENAGLVTITNANYPVYENDIICLHSPGRSMDRSGGAPANYCHEEMEDMEVQNNCQTSIKVRKDFAETWIFDNFEDVDAGSLVLQKKVPDTITSWVLTGFAIHPKIGLALTKNPTTIKTFRPFFIGTNLPYAVKRGEQVSIPVLIFNYMDQDVNVEVTLDNIDDEFEFMESGDNQLKRSKTVSVSSNSGNSVNFIIKPNRLGYTTLKLTAVSPLAGDTIHQQLKVDPEGITVFKNRDFFLNSEKADIDVQQAVQLDIPQNIVPDSEFSEFTVMGNILSSTIENIDNLVRLPCGCGEQIMVNFVPNILILEYLEKIQELTTAIEGKAKRYLEIGYQRELSYKHDDGSYSAFGKSDAGGSTWLTAYVIRSFHQATKYIDISPKIIDDGLSFLVKIQDNNGSFPEVGRFLDSSHLSNVGLTAFVLLTFLENSESMAKYNETIERGFEYLQQNLENTEDLYALSIALFALQQRKLDTSHKLLARLEEQAQVKGGLKWWSKKESQSNEDNKNVWYIPCHDIESTGYILMSLIEMDLPVLPIIKWLISKRSRNGGFGTTQDTIVGLWALIKFAEKNRVTSSDINVTVSLPSTDTAEKSFTINKENSMLIQTLELPKQTRELNFAVNGAGAAVLQISYRYNVFETDTEPSFKLNAKITENIVPSRMSMNVSIEYTPTEDTDTESNMVVLEVSLPSGYTAISESFDKIKEIKNVKRIETKECDTCIVIYFDNLKNSEVKSIPIEAELTHDVSGQKPVPIVIYDYYDNQKEATIFYEIENKLMQE